jgi:hypothetical protein
MRILNGTLAVTLVSFVCVGNTVQSQAQAPGATSAPNSAPSESTPSAQPTAASSAPDSSNAPTTSIAAAPAAVKPPLPSTLLAPSLNTVQDALSSLKLEKWKRGTVRDEATDNVKEVLHDVKSSLPDLMKAADSGPEAVSKTLPLSRNVGALYDVMLRVYEASRVVAPPDQVTQIQQALVNLKSARLALDERIQQTSEAAEKHTNELEVTVQKQAVALHAPPPTTTPPVCTPPAPKPAVKRKPRPKPATPATPGAKPGATTTPSTSSATTPKPTN